MIYQNDNYNFLCSIPTPSGQDPATYVTIKPLITVFAVRAGTVYANAVQMTLIPGTDGLYKYAWNIPADAPVDDYVALVNYSTNDKMVQNQFLERVRVGDSRVVDVVAKDATVAKEATTAKDLTVAHIGDLAAVSPEKNTTIQEILSKVSALPADPASNAKVNELMPYLNDIRGFAIGNWTRDLNAGTLTIFNVDGSLLATFRIQETEASASRTRV
jgi:DNA-directed RNA polymerase subunit F